MIEPLPPVNPDLHFASKINEIIEQLNKLTELLSEDKFPTYAYGKKPAIPNHFFINEEFFQLMSEKKNEYRAFLSNFVNRHGLPQGAMQSIEQKFDGFVDYWTERSKSGKQRWELEKTFEVQKRLTRWFKNDFGGSQFKSKSVGVIIT